MLNFKSLRNEKNLSVQIHKMEAVMNKIDPGPKSLHLSNG